jgi:branched-subunit amino acid aminotransferase/4-amino-4-deoxychorismate lyase
VIVYLNGDLVPEDAARISIDDAGFLSADGVFERR